MHVEKYDKSAVGHMLQHYNRNVLSFGNKDIDHMKSDLNYNLAPARALSDINYYRERLSQVKCQNRSDIKTLCTWIITLPKQPFTDTGEQRFFQKAYDFMAKRYGRENVISAWVHKDEAGQPHLHFCFIPICIDKKRGIEKVSAKEVLTRTELRCIHKEMSSYMEKVFGRDIGILNGTTVGGNRTVLQLKSETIQREISALNDLKEQSVIEMAQTIKRTPKIVSELTRAMNIALGKEKPPLEKEQSRTHERSR